MAPASTLAAPVYQELARRLVGADQGVYVVAEDGTVLADQVSARAVHPASVTKVATTLALLRSLGLEHRFATRFVATGPIREGTLAGDLLIESEGDPFLVSESALAVLVGLRGMGVARVAGGLRVAGNLLFNWKPDPEGRAIAAVLSGRVDGVAWQALSRADDSLAGRTPGDLGLAFSGRAPPGRSGKRQVLLVHRSPPLARILKEMNGYSNNVFHPLSDEVGGPSAVERVSRQSVPEPMREEIVITNAAGAGTTNRLSPRAAVALVSALRTEAAGKGIPLTQLLPVAGYDRGTLQDRFDGPELRGAVVGKTGTYGSLGASGLAGVARTRRWGEVSFAILNRGLAVPDARSRQDAFVEALLADAGPKPFPYHPPESPVLIEERIERTS